MSDTIKQITDAVIPVLITLALAMLPPLIARGIAWARAQANSTAIGAQSKIDDLFFDELEGSVAGLQSTADAWKNAQSGSLTDAQKKDLSDKAIASAVNNLKQHGEDFASKLPMQAASDWVAWHVKQNSQQPTVDPSKPPVTAAAASSAAVSGPTVAAPPV